MQELQTAYIYEATLHQVSEPRSRIWEWLWQCVAWVQVNDGLHWDAAVDQCRIPSCPDPNITNESIADEFNWDSRLQLRN